MVSVRVANSTTRRHCRATATMRSASLLGLMGCTSAVTLRHPQTGARVKCGPFAFIQGTAAEREARCIDDYQRQGYERVPE